MSATAVRRLREARDAFASNARNRDLRRTQLSFAAAWTSEWAFTVGLAIIAFRDGGAAAVGIVALVRMLPGAVAGPFLAALADRGRRERVIVAIGVARAASIGAGAALLALGGPVAGVYALAVAATIAGTPFRAAHSALLPSLCATPEELTSANAVRGMLDSLSTFLGPLAAAVLLGLSTPAAVLLAAAAASLWSAALVRDLRYEAPPRAVGAQAHGSLIADAREGLRALAAERDLALLIGLGVAQTFTRGCLAVLTVVVAIDMLAMGEAGVGVLTAAIGAGAVVGSVGASLLIGSRSHGGWFGLSVALWGLPLLAIAACPRQGAALAALAVIGVGNALLDVSFFSLTARLAPDEVLARVFGILEALIALSVAIGSILAPLAVAAFGVQGALLAIGSVCPLLAALAWRRLRRIDGVLCSRDDQLGRLRRVDLLSPLPMPVMDHLARNLTHDRVQAGDGVFEQGDAADRFYVIASGEAELVGAGAPAVRLRPGDAFGEIALLRGVPRTLGVRAITPLEVVALDSEVFLAAVGGYRASAAAAEALVASRLAALKA